MAPWLLHQPSNGKEAHTLLTWGPRTGLGPRWVKFDPLTT